MTSTIEVMSFNIYHDASSEDKALPGWPGRKDLVIRTIELHDPDVVGLQEALTPQVEELVEALPRYDYVGVGRDDGDRKGESVAILYRKARFELDASGHFWFSETPNCASKGGNSWGNFYQPRMTTWVRLLERTMEKGFYVYNLHLNHDGGAEDPELARWRSVILLTETISERDHDDSFIITGDFNATEDEAPIRYLTGKACIPPNDDARVYVSSPVPVIDVFRELHPQSQSGTLCSNKDESTGRHRIDYIFFWRGPQDTPLMMEAEILGKILGKCASDHRAVRAVFGLPLDAV